VYPARSIERACGARRRVSIDDTVTVIFSSGSTGEPKGVLLTHYNVDANVEEVTQVFRAEPNDRLLGVLPLFHSFGYLALWMCLNHRIGIVFHPNPLDASAVGNLVQRYRITVMIATPTFLQIYMKRCTPAQFGSLRMVLAGAEKLSERTALAFEDTFGIRPLEGYGTTECSPAIAMSTSDFRAPGFYQPGNRRGSVGQPLPGVSVRIVDPETFELLPAGTPGMLIVRGPNVMKGYLGRDDLTAEVLRDGWYVTGDIAVVDEDGFIKITDRLSRFSKIGGEMVPHGRIEEALHQAAGSSSPTFAVTAVPDEKKGEALAVLHTLDPSALPPLLEKISNGDMPNLFVPRLDHFVKVETLPLLGTGKLDLREVKRLATEALGKKTA
jgi:acyl-[acyl-carrier-protein]-phospholipid O-acyltransferase/long-chain-fatty-acid--[acyl-carrier-protein] ligase